MNTEVTFIDCPAYMDRHGTARCGLPAAVEYRYTVPSGEGPLEGAKIRCPRGHWFNGPIEALTLEEYPTAAAPSKHGPVIRLGGQQGGNSWLRPGHVGRTRRGDGAIIGAKPGPVAARGAGPQARDTAGTFTIKGMTSRSGFTPDEARAAGERIGIDWGSAAFDLEQFRMGMDVELEHGARDPQTNVTDDDVIMTAKIARAHLNEFPDYYTRLAKMEAEAEAEANENAQGE